MGKRGPVVVIPSSSEEDEPRNSSGRGGRGSSRSRSRSASLPRKRSRRGSSKKADGGSGAWASRELEVAKFDMLSEDFSECFMVPVDKLGSGYKSNVKDIWVDKHKPRTLAELAVHKKKVEEVKRWLEERVMKLKEGSGNCALLITGRAGVGKSAAIHVIASHLGAELCEWTTPTPTLWQEHVHHSSSGIRYISKLDEFENFVEKTSKYCLLPATYSEGSKKPVILLIDDLPMTNGRVAFERLSKCLISLARSAQVPTVILITEYHKTEPVNSSKHHWEELESTLERAGAHKVAFNPLAVNSIKKTLSRICQEENCDVAAAWIDQIAKGSGGDIRHAITSLQYFCLGPDNFSSPASTQTASHLQINLDEASSLSSLSLAGDEDLSTLRSLTFGRDETITIFHALGKFLHNKREMVDAFAQGSDSLIIQEKFSRKPLKMDAPEKVLSQAHGQARSIADFLHENVLDFISDEAVDDAWLVASYLCDADCLLASSLRPAWPQMIGEMYESESIAHSVGASVAVRGVLFGNSQPSPSRWHTIRRPRLWQIEQLSQRNKNQMSIERFEAYSNSCNSYNMFQIAPENESTVKWLRSQNLQGHHSSHEQLLWYHKKDDHVGSDGTADPDNLKGNSTLEESEEDDIEDW